MVRPKKDRLIEFNSDISYFKPRGIPVMDLEEVRLTVDEREAIRLADLMGLSHEDAGQKMGVSRATFGRIIQHARNTIADALIHGKAIHVGGGNFRIVQRARIFICHDCHHQWEAPRGAGRPSTCPQCKGTGLRRVRQKT